MIGLLIHPTEALSWAPRKIQFLSSERWQPYVILEAGNLAVGRLFGGGGCRADGAGLRRSTLGKALKKCGFTILLETLSWTLFLQILPLSG